MTDRDINHLHPILKPLCVQWLAACKAQKLNVKVTFTWRSIAQQNALYAQGRTTPGPIVTYARGGQSQHNFTLPDGTPASKAFDFSAFDTDGSYITNGASPIYARAAIIGEGLGLTWGGRWPAPKTDYSHLQIT